MRRWFFPRERFALAGWKVVDALAGEQVAERVDVVARFA